MSDLIGCVSGDHERFEQDEERHLTFRVPILPVESTWEQLKSPAPNSLQWRGKVMRELVIGSLLGMRQGCSYMSLGGDLENLDPCSNNPMVWRFPTKQPNIFEEFSLPSFSASAETRHDVAEKSAVLEG
jgi:hypothetical protein